MPSTDTLKKYVGAAGDALALIWTKLRSEPGEAPPVGSQDKYQTTTGAGGPGTAVMGGISTGTLLLAGVLWYLMKRR